jgi:hypothetical protein
MKYLLLLILTLYSTIGLAQNYRQYYRDVYKAELLICDQKFDSALMVYNKTFHMYKSPYCKDVYNAALCAIQVNDYKKAYAYLLQTFEYGVPLSYYDTLPSFVRLLASKQYKKSIARDYSYHHKKYEAGLKPRAKKYLDSLFYEDQKFRLIDTAFHDPRNKEIIRVIDTSNFFAFYNYVSKWGYPGLKDIGFSENIHIAHLYEVIFIHNMPKYKELLYPLMVKELEAGRMHPNDIYNGTVIRAENYVWSVHMLMRFSVEEPIKDSTEPAVSKLNKLLYTNLDTAFISEVNRRRAVWELESLQEVLRKVLIKRKWPEFCLAPTEPEAGIVFADWRTAAIFTKKMTPVEDQTP